MGILPLKRSNLKQGAAVYMFLMIMCITFACIGLATLLVSAIGGFILIAVSILGTYISYLMYKGFKQAAKYVSLVEGGVTSLDTIAASLRLPYDKVVTQLETLISRNFFTNVHIDYMNSKICFENNSTKATISTVNQVNCPSCGATCEVYSNKNNFCEHCGNALSLGK